MRALGVVSAVLLMLFAAGCGSDDGGGESSSAAGGEAEVRKLIDRYFEALASGETSTACDMLGKQPRERLAKAPGGTCSEQLKAAIAEVPKELRPEFTKAEIATLKVDGDKAAVTIKRTPWSAEGAGANRVELTRGEGGWLISELPVGGSPSKAAQCLQGGLESYEKGEEGSAFWKKQGRDVLVEYLKRFCVRIVREGAADDPESPAIDRVAKEVVTEMEREGLIKE